MSGKESKTKHLLTFNIISSIVSIVSIVLLAVGGITMANLDIKLSEEQIKCDDKDYSSYVKVSRIENPGNENINNQIDTVKRAMEAASNANDVVAFGQLYEKYNELLAIQSQTKTVDEVKDYSEADKAKDKCYKLAQDQKNADFTKSILLLAIGGGILVVLLAITIPVNIIGYSHRNK